uniref:E-selectin-like n=1 Tax=Styela clava TaxID=7725 RepID=UPI00193AD30A|nr:E-selectin-like [Styela clava]
MLGSNVLLVLFMGFICSTAEEKQHICREEGGVVYNRRCFWIFYDPDVVITSAQAEQKCIESNALPANIYGIQHFNQIKNYGREKRPGATYAVFLGMTYNPSNNVLKNRDGTISNLPDSVWVGCKTYTEVAILIGASPDDYDNGLGTTTRPTDTFRGVLCEIELICSPLQINMETQTLACSDSQNCIISCKPGFVLEDGSTSITLTCQDNLEWNGEVPTCRAVECTVLSFDGQSGLMQCTGNKYQNECNFVCDSHKQLKGPRKRICNEDGTWSEIQPTCEDVICEPIDFSTEQGTFDCTDGYNYASYCSFYCKSGLQRWGAKKVVCLWTGEWSEEPPTCKKYDPKCPAAHKHTSCPDSNCDVNADCDDDKKICCPTKCGTSVCWDLPKRTISREALLWIVLGGLGRKQFPTNCLRNACETARCPANLNAQCRTSCNSCRAHFYDFNQEVTGNCQCPGGYVVPNCNQQQCANYRCITHGQQISHYYASQYYNPNILCRMSSCGGCFPRFYDRRGRRINCRQILQLVSNPGIPVANLPISG